MGLIKKIFGGIFALIGGIFGAILKPLGIGKREFYMELDESASAVAEQAAEAVSAVKDNISEVAETVSPAASEASQGLSAEQKALSPSLNPDKPLVLPKPQADLQPQVAQGPATFATDFLVNPKLSRPSRRRPGPSISPFKEMAKQLGKEAASMG